MPFCQPVLSWRRPGLPGHADTVSARLFMGKQSMLKLVTTLTLIVTLPLAATESRGQASPGSGTRLFWGDLHVHSNQSPDSFAFGNARLTQENAFRFARGERVVASNGMEAQLQRPLDFLLVADHAEFIGVFPRLMARDPALLETELGADWRRLLDEKGSVGAIIGEWLRRLQDTNYQQELPAEFRRSLWQEISSTADRHNEPGQFTAFVGYEWTAMVKGNNLHRVVLFRDGAERASKLPPFSALDSHDPEQLWAALEKYETTTGGRVMSIPHNGNVSNGLMFDVKTLDNKPFDRAYAETRSRWEPIYEVTQVKGDGEAHPLLSPDDEFADFETWDQDNIARTVEKTAAMLPHEYARPALKLGLDLENRLGVNPYAFGLIGSTDSHTTLATADDDNFWGKFLDSEPGPERTGNRMGGSLWLNWRLAASGYAAVWARDNTREALFDALARKEVYATTGPRIALRFFGGWDFGQADINSPRLAEIGYAGGVPMGGSLPAPQGKRAPRFLIQAHKDPVGANLDRMQVVKGWLDADGQVQEKVFDVALSDGRAPDPQTGAIPSLKSTVDIETASYRNTIGATSFGIVWEDPEFDPRLSAFYYVRVIEIPTPRWTAYDARDYELELDSDIPMVTQERVYSSPIWYRP